jgi:hypothetical protein
MFCSKCGTKNESNVNFCSSCGNKIIVNSDHVPPYFESNINSIYHVNVQKDSGVAVLLALFFGPIGVFYVSIKSAIKLLAAQICSMIIGVMIELDIQKAGYQYPFTRSEDYIWAYFFLAIAFIIWIPISPIIAYKRAKQTQSGNTVKTNEVKNSNIHEIRDSNLPIKDRQNTKRIIVVIISLIVLFFLFIGLNSNSGENNLVENEAQYRSLATDQNISEDSTNVNNTTPEAEFKTTTVYSPSFDCNKASQAAEITICGNLELSKLDVQNTSLYKEAKEIDPETVKNILKISIKSKYSCKTNVECIKLLYDKSISDYSKIISKNNSN